MIEQKVVTVGQHDGKYYNFFQTPGSIGSLERMVNAGWIVKHIRDDGKTATVLFERTKMADSSEEWRWE